MSTSQLHIFKTSANYTQFIYVHSLHTQLHASSNCKIHNFKGNKMNLYDKLENAL